METPSVMELDDLPHTEHAHEFVGADHGEVPFPIILLPSSGRTIESPKPRRPGGPMARITPHRRCTSPSSSPNLVRAIQDVAYRRWRPDQGQAMTVTEDEAAEIEAGAAMTRAARLAVLGGAVDRAGQRMQHLLTIASDEFGAKGPLAARGRPR